MTERLTEKIMVSKDGEILGYRIKPFHERQATQKLAEYETAEDEGRLVVMPCKPGQDLFGIYNGAIVDGYADGYLMEKTSVHSDSEHWI